MTSTTDIIVAAFLCIFFLRGWFRGFVKSILGPLSLVAGTFLAYGYYAKTNKVIIALCISLFGPFIIQILLSFVFKIFNKILKNDSKPSMISGLIGGSISTLWSGAMLSLTILLIAFIPENFPKIKPIQEDVLQSISYKNIHKIAGDKIPSASLDVKEISAIFENPKKLKKLQSSKEYENLMEDTKFRDLMSDKKIQKDVEDKNFVALLKNPKMQAIMKDKNLVKKLFEFQKQLIDQKLSESPSSKKNKK
ncbi:hypothetical protein MNBD_BACTEROID05-1171 [hydrothermal vent metagenome]|uniref:Colicin V production protein n=1 Tax=hydrothermal vent metagenome TaxID=652676 RepID=A0A3B0TT42_9ZZZZ